MYSVIYFFNCKCKKKRVSYVLNKYANKEEEIYRPYI